MSGFQTNKNDVAIGNGGAGTPEVWDIISPAAHDFTGKIVTAFMCLSENGDTMDEMEEEYVITKGGRPGVTRVCNPKYLGYTYPQYCIFEGRYTKLVPTSGLFKVWFLK